MSTLADRVRALTAFPDGHEHSSPFVLAGHQGENKRLRPLLDLLPALVDSIDAYKMEGCVRNQFGEVEWARKLIAEVERVVSLMEAGKP